MARKSAKAAEIQLVRSNPRIEPPECLNKDEYEKWNEIIGSMPADSFRPENVPLLKELVRGEVACDRLNEWVSEALEAHNDADAKRFLSMRDRESRRVCTMMTKLRITPQSAYDALKAGRQRHVGRPRNKPWEA